MKKRKDIQPQYKWDFSDYFKNDEEWESSFNIYCKEIIVKNYKDSCRPFLRNSVGDIPFCFLKICAK